MNKISVKKTFFVSTNFKEVCAAKGYLEHQFSFLDVEITGNARAGYSLIVEWESENQKNVEIEISGIENAITRITCWQ